MKPNRDLNRVMEQIPLKKREIPKDHTSRGNQIIVGI